MSGRRRVKIHSVRRLLDDFFKIDRFWVSYQLYDKDDEKNPKKSDEKKDGGTIPEYLKADPVPDVKSEEGMSAYVRRLNFERGDAVGVLLFNVDTRSVVLVEQFKLSTLIGRRRDEPTSQDGWIVEVMAGMISADETPEDAAIRETEEETGYVIESPKLICKFLSSPGGTSERIFLFFAAVTDSNRHGTGKYGVGDENIRVLERNVNTLFDMLEQGKIDDPKLAIAAYWLKDNMHLVEDLRHGTVKFEVLNAPGHVVGYKTNSIEEVKDLHAWVNPENTDMMMDRFMGKSISAKIRYLGSNRSDEDDSVIEDTIQESLRGAVGDRSHVMIGTVLATEPGKLGVTHKVKRLYHVAAAEGGVGEGATVNPRKLKEFVKKVLTRVERENNGFWRRLWENNVETIIFPMMGAGEGGVRVEVSAQEIIPAAIDYFLATPNSTIKEVYFSAYKLRDKSACDMVFDKLCESKVIERKKMKDERTGSAEAEDKTASVE
jgi:nudix-type nucleoside diphosphatase (YffH/AdpP family)